MATEEEIETSNDAESRREHVRLLSAIVAATLVLLALIGWGMVGCETYSRAGVECVKRGDTLINGNCIPRSR